MVAVSLTYLDCIDLWNPSKGLKEPSGLALSSDRRALWTVSDDTKKIFKLEPNGKLIHKESFEIGIRGMEGITVGRSDDDLYVVREENNEVIQISIPQREIVDRRHLDAMRGYQAIAPYFTSNTTNKGLEGIAWNARTETLFVLKEAQPGLLVELSSDFQSISNYQLLNAQNGFIAPGVEPEKLDFSDICYDARRHCFWIVSDTGRRIFLYDWYENQVRQSHRLSYAKAGKYREIAKAEGVAIDLEDNRLYVASDEEAKLYIYDVRE